MDNNEDSYKIFEKEWLEQRIVEEFKEDINRNIFDADDIVDELSISIQICMKILENRIIEDDLNLNALAPYPNEEEFVNNDLCIGQVKIYDYSYYNS